MDTGLILIIVFAVVSFYLVYRSVNFTPKNKDSDEDDPNVIKLFDIPFTHMGIINDVYKKIIALTIYSIFLGLVTGFLLNAFWFFFCAFILGWGDSAPYWYFDIQNIVWNGIFVFSIILWAVILWPKEKR